jgi:hypothetical protein
MATTTLQENEVGDLFLVDGRNLGILSGAAACAQNIRDATQMRLGENQYNINEGVDYFGTVFTPQPDYTDFRDSLSQAILSCPDVLSIESLEVGPAASDPSILLFLAQVMTTYGLVSVEI